MILRKVIIEDIIVWLSGGIIYFLLEQLIRGYSHISMFICGGFALLVVGRLGEILKIYIDKKSKYYVFVMFGGSAIITLIELFTGIIVNVIMELDVWNYGEMFMNFRGQICFAYSVLWGFASLVCVKINYILRQKIFV